MSPKKRRKKSNKKVTKGAKKGKKGKKKAGKLKRLIFAVVFALAATLLTIGVLMVFEAVDLFPTYDVTSLSKGGLPVVGETMSSLVVASLLLFAVYLVLGVIYFFYKKEVRKNFRKTIKLFKKLPAIGKAIVVGLPFGVLATALVVVVDIYSWNSTNLSLLAVIGAGAAVWVATTAFIFQHLRRKRKTPEGEKKRRKLSEGVKILLIALATGAVFAILTGFLDQYVFRGEDFPGYSILLVLSLVVPVTTVLVASEHYNAAGGILTTISRKSGFAQKRQIQGITIAVAIGFVVALVLSTIVNLLVDGLLIPVLSFLLFLAVGTAGALHWFRTRSHARLDLIVTDIRNRSSGNRRRELAIRNEGSYPVDLRRAKIRDTDGDIFQTRLDVVLGPGQTTTFDIPPAFTLANTKNKMDVGGGWSLRRNIPVPVIVTRDGIKYELWNQEEKRQIKRERDIEDRPERAKGQRGRGRRNRNR